RREVHRCTVGVNRAVRVVIGRVRSYGVEVVARDVFTKVAEGELLADLVAFPGPARARGEAGVYFGGCERRHGDRLLAESGCAALSARDAGRRKAGRARAQAGRRRSS